MGDFLVGDSSLSASYLSIGCRHLRPSPSLFQYAHKQQTRRLNARKSKLSLALLLLLPLYYNHHIRSSSSTCVAIDTFTVRGLLLAALSLHMLASFMSGGGNTRLTPVSLLLRTPPESVYY
eukprot:GHVS01056156.1.p1 GENE.GHVS01056156.1~~GHVS01056156.1.p1  ORF type:complete len:121 (-),score=17.36 GHVS01056156.1:43-405(-)